MTAFVADVIEGRKKPFFVKGAFCAMSCLFEVGVNLRNFAFDKHWLKERHAPVPVISVGNIIAGGAGKTTVVQRLVTDLGSVGKIAILSRGYRSEFGRGDKSMCLNWQKGLTPEMCGDEPYLLLQSFPESFIYVGKNRLLGAKRAAHDGADLVILDDGMQHRSLRRDLEIVVLHGDDLYGGGFFLPRGYLRDSPKRLCDADLIIINHIHNQDHFHVKKGEVAQWSDAPVAGAYMQPSGVKLCNGRTLQSLQDKRVGLFCGLGKPHAFFSTVEEMGGEVIEKWILPDHVTPKKRKLHHFFQRCIARGCDYILCSEKDWIKLPTDQEWPIPLGFVRAELIVTSGREEYEELLAQIQSLVERGARR